jgi:ornithine cyclodeaminase/alanine dehydrogenase-like protein (mu-crystallin family)
MVPPRIRNGKRGAGTVHVSEEFLYLSDEAMRQLGIAPREIADAIEAALAQKSEGTLHVSPKSAVVPGAGRYMMATLSVGDGPGLTVVKVATVSPDNPMRSLPSINGAIIVLDAETGLLRAMLGANWITAERTAGLSAVAARRLASPDARSVAFIGCGVQAHSHLRAFADIFPLTEIRASGRGRENVNRLCKAAKAMGLMATPADTPREAIMGADLVVTSVSLDYTIEPFLDARWMKPGAFAAITDLGIPWKPDTLDAFGPIYVDDREQEAAAERPLVPADLVNGDLTDLVTGAISHDPDYPSAFAFRGIALGDFAAAALVYERARAQGIGITVGG